jgi:hypothetical protein
VRPLGDLLGQPVLFDATIDTWRQTGCGQYTDACLKHVEVLTWDKAAPLRRVDHAWIRIAQSRWDLFALCHKLGKKDFTLLESVHGAATVEQYERSDGSTDYGLQQHGFFGTEELFAYQRKAFNSKRYGRSYAKALARESLEYLGSLQASLSLIIGSLLLKREDWRAIGRDPAQALRSFHDDLWAVEAEIRRRVAAEAAADFWLKAARSPGLISDSAQKAAAPRITIPTRVDILGKLQ